MRLFVGDDWAEAYHDIEVMDETGRVMAKGRLPAGLAGMTRLRQVDTSKLFTHWANVRRHEPDDGDCHVRICEGRG